MTTNRPIALRLTPGRRSLRRARTGFAWLLALALIAALALSAAEPIKLISLKVGRKTYRRVTVLGASETDLYFRHAHGISNVKLRYLEPELQKRFGYDPKAAAEAERRQLEEDSAYLETVALDVGARAQKAAATAAAAAKAASLRAASLETSLADPTGDQSLLNQPAPKLEFGHWLGEKPETEGKAVLVFFWRTWSAPCRKAISDMNALQKEFHDQLVLVGLSTENEEEVASFDEVKFAFPLAVDPKGALDKTAGVTSVPQALLIDASGTVRYVGHPSVLKPAALKKLLTPAME